MLYFAKSEYNKSYDWSVKALELVGPSTPDKYVADSIFCIYIYFFDALFP